MRRIERGTAYHVDGDPGDVAGRPAPPPRPHDGDRSRLARRGRPPLPPRRPEAAVGDRRARPRPRRRRGGKQGDGPRPRPRRDRLPARVLRGPPAQPDRRRAHDVRAGQLGALPPQDLQRHLGRGPAADAAVALPDDPGDGEGEPRRNGERLLRQRRGDGGPHRAALHGGPRHRPLPLPRRPHPHAHEGRDPQPPDRDLALPRRRHRLGGRDPRRGRDRPRLEAEGRPVRLLGLEPPPTRVRAAVGGPGVAPRPHRLAARDHDRGADRGRLLQQRVRPAQPRRLLPGLRAGGGGRRPRLPQADHARGRRRQRARPARAEGRRAGGLAPRPARRPRDAHRDGRRLGLVHVHRRQHGRPRLRLRPARQRRDPAPGAGGDRPLLRAGQRQPDPLDPRRGGGRPLERAARARPRLRPRREDRPAGGSQRGAGDDAARGLVRTSRRSATSSRSRPRASTSSARCASASAARSRSSASPPTTSASR